jgi:hypothetical protein
VDEAGLPHVEITNDNHLGDFEAGRNMSISPLGMVSRMSSSYTCPNFPESPLNSAHRMGHSAKPLSPLSQAL